MSDGRNVHFQAGLCQTSKPGRRPLRTREERLYIYHYIEGGGLLYISLHIYKVTEQSFRGKGQISLVSADRLSRQRIYNRGMGAL
jgi:hypothetical protein